MAKPDLYTFSFKEVAELMLRDVDMKEGLWGIYVKFGIQAASAGPGPEELKPTAIVPILELGLQRMKEPSNLTVDAKDVAGKGPAKKATSRRPAAKTAK